tara:strand:- start:1539 stop:2192 length:654 start_codon:yes stop_codon:yes gene_type:complete
MRLLLLTSLMLLFWINGYSEQKTRVLLETKYGEVVILLYNETPKHKENFIKLINEGFYNNTLFHRVIPGFMIQGGDPESRNGTSEDAVLGKGGPGYTLPAEFIDGLFHKKGALAAARMGDAINPKKESSGSQFYLVEGKVHSVEELLALSKRFNKKFTDEQIKIYTSVGGTPHLDGDYTVFGEVVSGFDVITKISSLKRSSSNRPLDDVFITLTILK